MDLNIFDKLNTKLYAASEDRIKKKKDRDVTVLFLTPFGDDKSTYSTGRFHEEISSRSNFTAFWTSPYDYYISISNSEKGYDKTYHEDQDDPTKITAINATEFDAVIPRISGKSFDYGVLVNENLSKNQNLFSTADSLGLRQASNKMWCHQILSQNKIRSPKTVMAYKPNNYAYIINKLLGGVPVVAKLQRGSQGKGVFLGKDVGTMEMTLEAFDALDERVLLQQFVDTGKKKKDIRAFVVGDEIVAAYERISEDENDFRTNYSIHKKGKSIELTKEEKDMSIKTAKALKLGVCGVDLMRDKDNKPFVIEANGNPGLRGVEEITGVNVAGAIIDYVEDEVLKKRGIKTDRVKKKEGKESDKKDDDKEESNSFASRMMNRLFNKARAESNEEQELVDSDHQLLKSMGLNDEDIEAANIDYSTFRREKSGL